MSVQEPFSSKRTGPDDSSVVRDPFLFTQVVEVSVRSDSASTRVPDSLAATFAERMSAASEGAGGTSGTGFSAAAREDCGARATAWPLSVSRAISAASTRAVVRAMRGSIRLRR